MMHLSRIDPKKTAVLVIDMQNDFIEPGAPIFTEMGYEMCDRLNAFLDAFRAKGTLIIYSQNTLRADFLDIGKGKDFCENPVCIEGTHGFEIYPKVAPRPSDVVLRKSNYSFFQCTPLDKILRTNQIDTVIITGVVTDCCCFSTARDAGALNYNVGFISDLTGTVGYDDIGYGAFTAEQVHGCFLTTMAVTTADVMTAEDCLSRLI